MRLRLSARGGSEASPASRCSSSCGSWCCSRRWRFTSLHPAASRSPSRAIRSPRAKAEALADAALVRAAFSLGDPRPQIGWAVDGTAHIVRMPDGEAEVVAEDENGRINPNLASRDLLVQFFLALDAGRDTADSVSDAIMRRRAPPSAPLGAPAGAPNAASPAASPAGPCRRAKLRHRVKRRRAALHSRAPTISACCAEMPPELLAAAQPYLSVYSQAAVARSDTCLGCRPPSARRRLPGSRPSPTASGRHDNRRAADHPRDDPIPHHVRRAFRPRGGDPHRSGAAEGLWRLVVASLRQHAVRAGQAALLSGYRCRPLRPRRRPCRRSRG